MPKQGPVVTCIHFAGKTARVETMAVIQIAPEINLGGIVKTTYLPPRKVPIMYIKNVYTLYKDKYKRRSKLYFENLS